MVMRIICARCQRDVDEVRVRDELPSWSVVIEARCHGDVEVMRLSLREAQRMPPDQLAQITEGTGVAFAQGRPLPGA